MQLLYIFFLSLCFDVPLSSICECWNDVMEIQVSEDARVKIFLGSGGGAAPIVPFRSTFSSEVERAINTINQWF